MELENLLPERYTLPQDLQLYKVIGTKSAAAALLYGGIGCRDSPRLLVSLLFDTALWLLIGARLIGLIGLIGSTARFNRCAKRPIPIMQRNSHSGFRTYCLA